MKLSASSGSGQKKRNFIQQFQLFDYSSVKRETKGRQAGRQAGLSCLRLILSHYTAVTLHERPEEIYFILKLIELDKPLLGQK